MESTILCKLRAEHKRLVMLHNLQFLLQRFVIVYNYYATDNSVHSFHRIEYYTQIPL